MLKLGIDDAGRGPVIGPMVLAGCLAEEKAEDIFKKEGVKDSKQLTQKRREYLEKLIQKNSVSFEVVVVEPEEIDGKTENNKLNELEAIACAQIINKLNSGKEKIKVVIDCPSVSPSKWRDFLRTKVENLSNLEIACEHKADVNHVIVSAASILAKCTREREMEKLREKYGKDIGSGYTSDPLTQKFLEKNITKYQNDGIFRKSWITFKDAKEKQEQKKLNF